MQKKNTRKNWHVKSAEKVRAKIGTLNLQNEAVPICKRVRAKIGMLNLQNEAVPICKKTTRKNWHVKSAKRGSAYLQKKYAQKLAC